jgi:hypothetical protein
MKKSDKDVVREFLRQTGAKGGRNRAKKLTSAQRTTTAKKAAAARWKGRNKNESPTKGNPKAR